MLVTQRGFLPEPDPLTHFPESSEFAMLDEVGRDLPSLLEDRGFRSYARELVIPLWPKTQVQSDELPVLRLYYLRVGFLASAYVNQIGQEPTSILPVNIAVPLCQVCTMLQRPPILSYDGYALYNWKRCRPTEPIALGNLETLQNFVHLYDEHWFILVHVEIEAIAAELLGAIDSTRKALAGNEPASIEDNLKRIEQAIRRQVRVLKRIPEKMDPGLYHKTFRRYIRFFEDVTYEGVNQAPISFRGETGAQSSILPVLVAFLKVPHKPSPLMNHLVDMRRYMPPEHRTIIEEAEHMPSIRHLVNRETFNSVLQALAEFREVHFNWAEQYINRWVNDPRGTGGTPYMQWLKQLIDETKAYQDLT
ncbi:MAG: hypothetical protein U9P00_06210 [Pseudomonadota bacterium]|nr:hypothetical protein [Pseudomonadota bacterium]